MILIYLFAVLSCVQYFSNGQFFSPFWYAPVLTHITKNSPKDLNVLSEEQNRPNQFTNGIGNRTDCEELKDPGWTIDNLRNTVLDAWPHRCLTFHFGVSCDSIHKAISKSSPDIYDASSRGYLGFVQYYRTVMGADLFNCGSDGNGYSPLHLAARNGHLSVVQYLFPLLYKSMTNKECGENKTTPAMEAAFHGQLAVLKHLIEEVENRMNGPQFIFDYYSPYLGNYYDSNMDHVDHTDKHKKRILFYAAASGDWGVMNYLIRKRYYFGLNELDPDVFYLAAVGNSAEVLQNLVLYDGELVRLDYQHKNEFTALHAAAEAGKFEAVKYLIEILNYKVDFQNTNNETPSHFAVKGGHLPVLKYLIEEKGANLNAKTVDGNSLLHYAASYDQLDIVKYLVEGKGVDIELLNDFQRTPLHQAVGSGRLDVAKYLVVEKKANLNSKDRFNMTLLHQAIAGKRLDVDGMKYLVDDLGMLPLIEEVDKNGRTVAMVAARNGQLAFLQFLIEERNASLKTVTAEGKNLLHVAARENELPTVRYLMEEKGFDLSVKTAKGETAYDLAKQYKWNNGDMLAYFQGKLDAAQKFQTLGTYCSP